ncbi:helix-turn-helix domain-containing protein [Alkanindiges illinoisensis]|jgi:DNA-binding XRE family transcriptional regulator|uniref:XRE family transcriptional regulator n=1 Tax=Alkanindiges illinoisensis TaxID=197183 RepID=A0A4Y7XAC4_9GAMM|nr:helix-turn-helix transcriptional regulator [Alkanindiges illinoisensis]TEU24902.1 XRE family transcriptional regulator [Alkanindiges illinoisensis]
MSSKLKPSLKRTISRYSLETHQGHYLIPAEVINAVFDRKSSSMRAWRKYLGLRKKHLAQQLGISKSQYSRLEAKKKPSKALLRQMAMLLGIHVKQLNF